MSTAVYSGGILRARITLASASYGENGIKEKEVQTSLSLDFLKTELTPIGVTAASYAPDSFVVILPESRFSAHFKEVATDSMPNLCLTSKDASKTETDIEALFAPGPFIEAPIQSAISVR